MPVICVIEFDNNPHGTYFAGQEVTGKITLKTTEVKKVNALTLKITGFAHTNWSESIGGKFSIWYTGHEDHLESVTYLMGSAENTQINIEPGIYSYSFACKIPITCPSSFEGINGHIRYAVTVCFGRSWKFDENFTRSFSVSKILNMNYEYEDLLLYEPVRAELQHTFGCGRCKTDPLKINVSIPQSGYVPGQVIPIDVLVNNESDVRVKELKCLLVMYIHHVSQTPYANFKNQKIKVIKTKGEGVQCKSSKNATYELLIPATPPSCLSLSRIMKITYELQVEAKVKGCRKNPLVCIPILMDNIPPSTVRQQQAASAICNPSNASNTVLPKTEYHLEADPENLRYINARSNEIAADVEQKQNRFSSTPPPSFDEAVATTSGSQIVERQNDGFSAAMTEHNVNLPTATFEEGAHLYLGKYRKNTYRPRYPVYRNVCTVECNADSTCARVYNNEKDKSTES